MSVNLPRFFRAFSLFILPFSFCFVLLLLMLVPFPVPYLSNLKPFLPFIPIYYYAVYLHPDRFSCGFVFLTGLFADLLFAIPFGIMTFICLLYYLLVSSQSKFFYGKPFVVVFSGFALSAFGATVFEWLFVSIYYARFISFSMLFFSYLFLICLYFPLSLVAARIVSVLKKEGAYDPRF